MRLTCVGAADQHGIRLRVQRAQNIRVKHRILDLNGDMVREVRVQPGKVGDTLVDAVGIAHDINVYIFRQTAKQIPGGAAQGKDLVGAQIQSAVFGRYGACDQVDHNDGGDDDDGENGYNAALFKIFVHILPPAAMKCITVSSICAFQWSARSKTA